MDRIERLETLCDTFHRRFCQLHKVLLPMYINIINLCLYKQILITSTSASRISTTVWIKRVNGVMACLAHLYAQCCQYFPGSWSLRWKRDLTSLSQLIQGDKLYPNPENPINPGCPAKWKLLPPQKPRSSLIFIERQNYDCTFLRMMEFEQNVGLILHTDTYYIDRILDQ